jgi:hypothetical protein
MGKHLSNIKHAAMTGGDVVLTELMATCSQVLYLYADGMKELAEPWS